MEDTAITETMTVFARTNYTKFKIEETTIKGYTGEKPRGRIIIPKEITRIWGFRDCEELTSVDLSLCKELTYCNLESTGIASIDISKNTELTTLYLDNTKITNIDISKNIELKLLSLNNTGITNIELSNNTKLTELYLSKTEITSIDVSKNPNITYLLFINCSNLTAIDLSTCTNLDTISFQSFMGTINAVVTLPLSIKKIDKNSFGYGDYNYCKKVVVPNNKIKQLVLDSSYPEARIEVKL